MSLPSVFLVPFQKWNCTLTVSVIIPDCSLKEGQSSDPGAHAAPRERGHTLSVWVPVFCHGKSDFVVSPFLELLVCAGCMFITFL